ncbi:MAG: glutaredoxin family protein [Candidatus Flexifilum sp.]|jgi:glutaredoxin
MSKRLVMYVRSTPCPFMTVARRVLQDYQVDYTEVFIDRDEAARRRVLEWTGFLSVPTIVVAEGDSVLPFEPPAPLERGRSPRGIDRGAMITEANREELAAFLLKHGFIREIVRD